MKKIELYGIILCLSLTLSADKNCMDYMDGTRVSSLHSVNCPCHCARYPFAAKWNTCLSCKHAHPYVPIPDYTSGEKTDNRNGTVVMSDVKS